ncbi:ABC transporter ATP-binding protein [Candidatus Uhrbacteria bacterium]|nr:ABC transporter ATP-binding protein [Candidatus Uhrbacteria bacterium]
MLSVKNLTKHFGGVQAVDGCHFEIDSGKITALIGPNGAGKTTVFNLISGFFPVDSGEIFFKNINLTHQNIWRRSRAGISRTFQTSRLFRNLSIEDNLLIALREDDDQFLKMFLRTIKADPQEHSRIQEMMTFVGLDKDPHTIVTDLSYGQQKLFDLARALLNPHDLLMLDEPVAGVNPVLRDQFKKTLCALREKGETVLLIEHDMDFVRRVADKVIVMNQGRVLTQGLPHEVLSDARVLEAYLGPAL